MLFRVDVTAKQNERVGGQCTPFEIVLYRLYPTYRPVRHEVDKRQATGLESYQNLDATVLARSPIRNSRRF